MSTAFASVTALYPRRQKVAHFSLPSGDAEFDFDRIIVPQMHRDFVPRRYRLQHVREVLEREQASDAGRALEERNVLLRLLPVDLVHVPLAEHLEALRGRYEC